MREVYGEVKFEEFYLIWFLKVGWVWKGNYMDLIIIMIKLGDLSKEALQLVWMNYLLKVSCIN